MPSPSVEAALRRMDRAAGRPERPVEPPEQRDGPDPYPLDACLRRRFLAALDADLALDPRGLLAAGPIRWPTIARSWWAR